MLELLGFGRCESYWGKCERLSGKCEKCTCSMRAVRKCECHLGRVKAVSEV